MNSQLLAVVIDNDFARTFRGKISPVTTQAQGPQEQAKKKMLKDVIRIPCHLMNGPWFFNLGMYSLDAYEGDQSLLSSQILDSGNSTCDGNDELADAHSDSAK